MTKYYSHFLILNTFVIVPVMSQCSYTALPSNGAGRGCPCHLAANKWKNVGRSAESYILADNSTTAVILVRCNKKM
jgi:hypothetical protein